MPFSLRELTKQQFADGTTVDGNRLEQFLKDTVGKFNKLGLRDKQRRFFHNSMVMGFTPSSDTPCIPYLPVYNDLNLVTGTKPLLIQNPERLKGYDVPYLHPEASLTTFTNQYAWTTALYFKRPVILTNVSVCMFSYWDGTIAATSQINSNFNPFVYKDPAPIGEEAGGYVDDIYIDISSDGYFMPEDRSMTESDFKQWRFKADSHFFADPSITRVGTDMLPPWAANAEYYNGDGHPPYGIAMRGDNLNIPLTRDARTRLSLVIPGVGVDDTETYWTNLPWTTFYTTLKLTWLEEAI